MQRDDSWLRWLVAACLGGAWGGALAGFAEATLITATSAPGDEFWIFPFAVLWYGGLGVALGLAGAIALGLLQGLRRKRLLSSFGVGAAFACACLVFVVARYHVNQRLFAEQLVTASPQGLAVHGALLVAVALVGLLLWWLARPLQHARHGIAISGAALLLLLVVSAGAAALAAPRQQPLQRQASGSSERPNIILIVVDTLRADGVGVYAPNAGRKTPHLDAFAQDAVRFQNAFSQSSWTRPSVATILTSLYPSAHGAYGKLDPLPDEVTTVAEMLRAEGYWTAGIVSNINVAPVFNFQQGFAEYHYLAPSFYFGASDSATRLAIYKGLRVARERFFGERIYFYHYYQDAEVVNAATLQFLSEAPPAPFFLLIHYMDPHDPYFEIPYNGHGVARVRNPAPPASEAAALRKLYDEDITYFDDHFQSLLQRLRELGLYDRSVIALTADHGEEFFDHGGWWHGTALYEEQVHVPLIVRRPREPRTGNVETRLARTIDIVPTLLAAAGIKASSVVQGRDLFAASEPLPLFAEEQLEGNLLTSYRSGDWKLITANPGNPRGVKPIELYNLATDPLEKTDLSASEPERVRLLSQELNDSRLRAARGEAR